MSEKMKFTIEGTFEDDFDFILSIFDSVIKQYKIPYKDLHYILLALEDLNRGE